MENSALFRNLVKKSIALTNNTATTGPTITQPLELSDAGEPGIFDLGSEWFISCWVKPDQQQDVTLSLSFADDSNETNAVASDAVVISDVPAGDWTRVSSKIVITQTPASSNLCCNASVKGSVAASQIKFAGWQVETAEGIDEPRDYQKRPRIIERGFCQRYWVKSYLSDIAPASYSILNEIVSKVPGSPSNSSTKAYSHSNYRYPVEMRTTPSTTIYEPRSGNIGSAWRNGSNSAIAGISLQGVTSLGFFGAYRATSLTAGDILSFHYAANARL